MPPSHNAVTDYQTVTALVGQQQELAAALRITAVVCVHSQLACKAL